MATVVTPPAESAPAEPQPNFEPSTYSPEEYATWNNTGKVPQSKAAESTTATESAGAPQGDEPATESAPVVQQEHKAKGNKNAETRIQELLRERNEWKAKAEARSDVKAEPSPAKKEPKLEKPVKPVFGETGHAEETWLQFEARQDAHVEALASYQAKEVLRQERESNEKNRLEAETKAQNEVIEKNWKERLEVAQSLHADFAEVAFSKDTPITPAMDGFILDSPVGPQILYALGKDSEGKRIAALGPYAAVRELVKIELSLSEASPKPKETPPAIPITKAAKPATDLNATHAAPTDELRAAIEAADVTRFMDVANARDVARRKKG